MRSSITGRKSSRGLTLLATLVLGGHMALAANGAFAAPTVTMGFDPLATLKGAVRYRNFNSGGGPEIQIGATPLSTSSPTTVDVAWGAFPINKCVQLSYDGVGTLTTKVAAMADPCVFGPTATAMKTGLSLGALNYLELTITKNTQTISVAINGVKLNTDSLGNVAVNSGSAGTTKWMVTGADLTTGFTLSGTLALTGMSGGGDSNNVQIDVGYVEPTDGEGPVTSSVSITPEPVLLNGDATVTAKVDDTTTGGSNIASAAFYVNGGDDTPMDATDGAFDEVSEDVTATFSATELGLNEVCVWGTDTHNNVGEETCQTFLVTYQFDGFYSPIVNTSLNVVKAGQAIPVKWLLTDADDVPIEDPMSFAGLYSYEINCSDSMGEPLTSVEEVAPGSSGLQYNSDGYWQFNWKTPKVYASTCRAMYVMFDSGATTPVVKFSFKK